MNEYFKIMCQDLAMTQKFIKIELLTHVYF